MRGKYFMIGLLVVGVALLSGCDLLDDILDAIVPGGEAQAVERPRPEPSPV